MGEVIFWVLYTLLFLFGIGVNVIGLIVAASVTSILLHTVCMVGTVVAYTVTAINT